LGQADAVGAKTPIFSQYSLVGPQWYHLAKSLMNTNRKSYTRFPMSLRWTSYVAPKLQKKAQKRKKAVFQLTSHFAWRSATKFLCVKTVSDNVLTHSLA